MAPLRSIGRRLSKLVKLDAGRGALLVEAAAWLLIVRAALILIPFPRLAGRLGTFVPPEDGRAAKLRSPGAPGQCRLAGQIGWAVTRAARHVPFRAVCLPQAIAARMMLRRRGVPSVLYFGVGATKSIRGTFEPHAWLQAAGTEVTGYPEANQSVAIACFV